VKSKERGCKIFRGIVQHPDKNEANTRTNIFIGVYARSDLTLSSIVSGS
jgi:hypothetical protein